jgi:hypothetical protein
VAQRTARFYEKDGCLWFNLVVPSTADRIAVPFEFDGPATNEHVKGYPGEFQRYVKDRREADEAKFAELQTEILMLRAQIKDAVQQIPEVAA